MSITSFGRLSDQIKDVSAINDVGRVSGSERGVVFATGLSRIARVGDSVSIEPRYGNTVRGEIIRLEQDNVTILIDGNIENIALRDPVEIQQRRSFCPDESWIGRVIDPYGQPLDGIPLMRGSEASNLLSDPPLATSRRAWGDRLETGLAALNTVLPLVKGQRVGLFAGSGVGKSTLLAQLARGVDSDVAVIALIGERGREVRDFIENVLGKTGMARSVVIAATSDQSPLVKRRAAFAAMTVAEYFRDKGKHVLLLADSLTRFAEAHRDVAAAAGEAGSVRGFPPTTAHMISSLCERAGPGSGSSGDITAVFSVLVAGSDMEEPIADIVRGVLDGHIVLDRTIAERGRFPAIDVVRSVSRSLPDAANSGENAILRNVRQVLSTYESAELMIRSGLYAKGASTLVDNAVSVWPSLDAFLSEPEPDDTAASFSRLGNCFAQSGAKPDA